MSYVYIASSPEAFPGILGNMSIYFQGTINGTLANILREQGNKTNFEEQGILKISFREQGNKADNFKETKEHGTHPWEGISQTIFYSRLFIMSCGQLQVLAEH